MAIAGAEDPRVARHAGFEPAPTVREALDVARAEHGSGMRLALFPYPPAASRR